LSPNRRFLVVVSLVLPITYLIPFAFLLGAAASLSGWDDVVAVKATDRRWFIAWVIGLVLAGLGAIYTFFIFPRLAPI